MPRSLLILSLVALGGTSSLLSHLAPLADAAGASTLARGLDGIGSAHAADDKKKTAKPRPLYRRTMRKAHRIFHMRTVTQSNEDATADSVATELSYSGPDGETETVTATTETPTNERVFFDWTPPEGFTGGPVVVSSTGDGFPELSIELGGEPGWQGDSIDLEASQMNVRPWRRGNGDYRFRIKGKPASMAEGGFGSQDGTPAASVAIDGTPAAYQFTRRLWKQRFDIPEGVDVDEDNLVTSTSFAADGQPIQTLTGVMSDQERRDGTVIENLQLNETNAGHLKLRADLFSDDRSAMPTMNFDASDKDGASLLVLEDAAPTHSEFQFTKTFELVEADNFTDRTYVASIELIDASGDVQLANFDVVHTVGEGLDVAPLLETAGDWSVGLTLSYLENYTAEGSEEGGSDVGFLRLSVAGPQLSNVASANVRLVPDDGGTDLEAAGDDGDPETVEPDFVGAWHQWTQKGNAGSGGLGNPDTNESIFFNVTSASNGDFEAPLGETDLLGGSAANEGIVYRATGFGSGTRRSTSSAASARPELQ